MEIKNKWETLKAKGRIIFQLVTDNHNSNFCFGVCMHVCIFIYTSVVALNTADSEEIENIPGLNQRKLVISVLFLVLSLVITNTLLLWYLVRIEA